MERKINKQDLFWTSKSINLEFPVAGYLGGGVISLGAGGRLIANPVLCEFPQKSRKIWFVTKKTSST